MRTFTLALLLSSALLPAQTKTSPVVPAQSSEETPAIIQAGVEAYKAKGPEEAVKAWIKGSPIDGSKDALSQANTLRQIQDFYGAFQSFDLIRIQTISKRSEIVYATFNYDTGPLFARFVLYKTEKAWILTNFTFNTKVETVLPNQP